MAASTSQSVSARISNVSNANSPKNEEMIVAPQSSNEGSLSTAYKMRPSHRDRASTRTALSHHASSTEAITLAMQKLSDKLQRLERERDAAIRLNNLQRPTTNGRRIIISAAAAAHSECISIEDSLHNILRTCNDVKSVSPKLKQSTGSQTSVLVTKSRSDRAGRRTKVSTKSEPRPLSSRTSSTSVVMTTDIVPKFGSQSHRLVANIRTTIGLLKMGRPQLDADAQSFDTTYQILNIVQHYLREAVLVLRDIVGYLTIEWVQLSKTIKSTEDATKISFLKERIRILKLRRTNLTVSAHRLEALKRKVDSLIHSKFADNFIVTKAITSISDSGSPFMRNRIDREKAQNSEFHKYCRGLDLLKCIQKLQHILSHV